MSSGQITFLVLVAALLLAGCLGYFVIRSKIQKVSQTLFGTKSLLDGLEQQADVLAETPKSVSAMTRIFEPQIQRDFPDFHMIQFRNQAENMLVAMLQAVSQESMWNLKNASNDLQAQIENQIETNRAEGIHEKYLDIHIHQTEIANYQKKDGKCIITFQSAVEYIHYKERGGSLCEGSRERKEQTKYNMELVYIQDETLTTYDNAVGTVCPHCGAPIRTLGQMKCEYCGSEVVPVNVKVWNLQKIYEVDYHHV